MSQYQKPCTYCKSEIRMSNNTGKWLPMNLDGSFHSCNTNIKKVAKERTVEERLKRLEQIVLDPRR